MRPLPFPGIRSSIAVSPFACSVTRFLRRSLVLLSSSRLLNALYLSFCRISFTFSTNICTHVFCLTTNPKTRGGQNRRRSSFIAASSPPGLDGNLPILLLRSPEHVVQGQGKCEISISPSLGAILPILR